MEDCLKTIYILETDGEGELVRPSAIAEVLEVTPSTVTNMLETLAERGLVTRKKYHGVRLTADGKEIALEVLRHHRLLESFMTEHLDYPWDEVHEEADRLEHHISENLEDRIASVLQDPDVDPHGAPIPTAEHEHLEETIGEPLSRFEPGNRVRVRRFGDERSSILEYLHDRDIAPGTALRIEETAPFGMVTVQPETVTEPVSLPGDVADEIYVSEETAD